jgi:hypothetical protein
MIGYGYRIQGGTDAEENPMDGGKWLDGAIPGDGGLRPGNYSNYSNYPDNPDYSDYSYNGKAAAGGG